MRTSCRIYDPLFSRNDKKYIKIELPQDVAKSIEAIHKKKQTTLDPLEGHILCVKVPWRYNRIMCKNDGRSIYEATRGTIALVEIEYKGPWFVNEFSGHTWVLKYINL